MNKRHFLLIPALLTTLSAIAQDRPTDPLSALTACVNDKGFHADKKDRLPVAATSRLVNSSAGQARVSTVDGYRLMVYRKSTSPLVNLKLERSAEGQFSADRAVIIAQMRDMASQTKPPHQLNLETSTRDGIELLALNNPSIEHSSGVISFYTLFDARSNTVATAYLLNQRPEIREYADDAEYTALRDQFIDLLSSCLLRAQQ
jgi:hypothetical protein